jgi:hypothetical protein
VHTKNPIFDPEYLKNMARVVAENGFDWKAPSCLVVCEIHASEIWNKVNKKQLIVCALATISAPFESQTTSAVNDNLQNEASSLNSTPGYSTAELYYTAARKRIGLLTNTLLTTECHFLAGVYEMYSLRPLQAAISFNRACVAFQTLTWVNPENYLNESQLGKARANRLYWSCLKSEQ